nr:adenylate kinase [Enterocytospora artemiae]
MSVMINSEKESSRSFKRTLKIVLVVFVIAGITVAVANRQMFQFNSSSTLDKDIEDINSFVSGGNRLRIAMFGLPASGKGTVGSKLAETFKLKHVSSGDLLRNEMKRISELKDGESALSSSEKEAMSSGKFVSDEFVIDLLKNAVGDSDYVLDGFPRSLSQIDVFPIDVAVYLNVPEEKAKERMFGRSSKEEQQRDDDNATIFQTRVGQFLENTHPVITELKTRGMLVEVDGSGEVEDVFTKVVEEMRKHLIK